MSIRIAGIDRLRRWVDQHRGQPLSLTPEQAEVIDEGEVWVRNVGDDLDVVRADPRVLISEDLVNAFRVGELQPAVSLDGNDVLRIRVNNRTVIYRLVEHVPAWRAWIAEKPD